MNTTYKYILEPYKGMNTRHKCPTCQSNKTFSLYIDTETGEILNTNVGRCNRESKCGFHYNPKQYFEDNPSYILTDTRQHIRHTIIKNVSVKPGSTIPLQIFKDSLKGYNRNNFIRFLFATFGPTITGELISKYFIGTSKHWPGGSIFWQVDNKGKVCTGKIMLYNPHTGKRVKEPYNHITWAHTALKLPEFNLKQCLFGSHLLVDKTKPIALCESEKTAIVASVYLPQFIWLAVGSLSNLTADKCIILKGRSVILFPDLNGFSKWSTKAKELSFITTFIVSDLLERKATPKEKEQGLDIADYLLRFDYRHFTTHQTPSHNHLDTTPIGRLNKEQTEVINPAKVSTMNLIQFQTIALTHFDNYKIRTYGKGNKKEYLIMWADGMLPILEDAGITKESFIGSINYN